MDLALVRGGTFEPIEVKWTAQLRPKDLAQVARYPNDRIWARAKAKGEIHGVPVEPLPLALFRLTRPSPNPH